MAVQSKKVVTREEIEGFFSECPFTWIYVAPFKCEGLMVGPTSAPVKSRTNEGHDLILSDELLAMAEEYVDDCFGVKAEARRFLYDAGGKVVGILYQAKL